MSEFVDDEEDDFLPAWVEKSMRARRGEFSTYTSLNLQTGTFNLNNKILDSSQVETLVPWLVGELERGPDLYALSMQELVDLNTMNVVFDGQSSLERMAYWREHILKALNRWDTEKYTILREGNMVGVGLFIIVRNELKEYVTDVRVTTTPVGVLGVMGNKGAVACRLNIYDTSMCFISTHLASGQTQVEQRNSDYQQIMRRTNFGATQAPNDPSAVAIGAKPWRRVAISPSFDLAIGDHELIVWMGDLNYRIDDMEREDIMACLAKQNLETLLAKDQLLQELGRGDASPPPAFENFQEAPITFAPTYVVPTLSPRTCFA